MFKKILRILTYNGDGDGDNICGDGVGMGTLVMGWDGDGARMHGDGVGMGTMSRNGQGMGL